MRIVANLPFRTDAPAHWTDSDKGVHLACMAWACHHAACDVCGEHDWQRPGAPLRVEQEDLLGRWHVEVKRADGSSAYYIDEEDPDMLCDIGRKLYLNWGREIIRRVLKQAIKG